VLKRTQGFYVITAKPNVMLLPLRLLRLLPLPLPLNHQMLLPLRLLRLLPLPLPLNHPSSSFSWQKHPPNRLQWPL
jgi:hypothetical protein